MGPSSEGGEKRDLKTGERQIERESVRASERLQNDYSAHGGETKKEAFPKSEISKAPRGEGGGGVQGGEGRGGVGERAHASVRPGIVYDAPLTGRQGTHACWYTDPHTLMNRLGLHSCTTIGSFVPP